MESTDELTDTDHTGLTLGDSRLHRGEQKEEDEQSLNENRIGEQPRAEHTPQTGGEQGNVDDQVTLMIIHSRFAWSQSSQATIATSGNADGA